MPRGDTQSQNHPRPGSAIRVEPIRDRRAIARIKKNLRRHNLRDFCLFTLGINTAYRGCELLSLTVGQVAHLRRRDVLAVKQSKNRKYRSVTMNGVAVEVIKAWLADHPARDTPDAPLFLSQRSDTGIGVSALNHMVKRWCAEAGLKGNYGSHTLRKTWGYHQRKVAKTPIPLLMIAFGHSTQAQTLAYLCIQEAEVRDLFTGLEL